MPAWLAIVTLHVCLAWITFVIAVQWGEFESTDSMESVGKCGGSFEVARSTVSFWVSTRLDWITYVEFLG